MSKSKRLRKRFTAFVNQLTPDQVREQLVLAYLQMEKCQNVLKGYDVEPVKMMDNGDNSDLELFYRCKKTAEELAYLNGIVATKPQPTRKGRVDFKVDVSEQVQRLRALAESFRKLGKYMEPRQLTIGKEVFFLSKGSIHKSILEDFIGIVQDDTGDVICRVKGHDIAIPARYLYSSAEQLAKNIGKTVSNHISFSSDHESAYFIDSTSRVFKGAKWYLEEQKIDWYDSLDEMRGVLLQTIIDDGKEGK